MQLGTHQRYSEAEHRAGHEALGQSLHISDTDIAAATKSFGFWIARIDAGNEEPARQRNPTDPQTKLTSPRPLTNRRRCGYLEPTLTLLVWANPFTNLRVPKIFNLRTDPYERADTTSNTYLRLPRRNVSANSC